MLAGSAIHSRETLTITCTGTRALFSVFDKTGCVELAKVLSNLGVEIVSTGGTAKALQESSIKVTQVADVTHFPELLEGRVKTLHPAIHAGLLAKPTSDSHMKDMQTHNLKLIQLVRVILNIDRY